MIVWRGGDIVGIKPHWSLNCIVSIIIRVCDKVINLVSQNVCPY